MKRIPQTYLLPIVLLTLGLFLIWTSTAQADSWMDLGVPSLNSACTNQTQTCFSSPSCAACSGGQQAWRNCGSLGGVQPSCQEAANRVTGDCTGTPDYGPFLCYDVVNCSNIFVYSGAGC